MEAQAPVVPKVVEAQAPPTEAGAPGAGTTAAPPLPPLGEESRIARRWVVAIVTMSVMASVLFVYVEDTKDPSAEWDGGRWSEPSVFPVYGIENLPPRFFTFGGALHMFVPVGSKQYGTPGGTSSGDFGTADTLHFVREGGRWLAAPPLSDPADEASVFAFQVTPFAGKTYAVRWTSVHEVTDVSRPGVDLANINRTVEIAAFDGVSLRAVALLGGRDQFGGNQEGPSLVVYGDQLLAFWRNDTTGRDNASTIYWRSFDGKEVSALRSFELPTTRGFVTSYMARPEGLFVAYMGRNSSSEPASLFLGRFDGQRIAQVARIAEGLATSPPSDYGTAVDDGNQLVFVWENHGQNMGRTYQGGTLSAPIRVPDGVLSGLMVSGEKVYCLLWGDRGSLFHSNHHYIATFDGATWGVRYQVSGPVSERAGLAEGKAFHNEVIVSWATYTPKGWSFAMRSFVPGG